jgi:glucokinase
MSFLLTIDLGGTRSRVGLTDLGRKDHGFSHETVYRNEDFTGIDEVIDHFFGEYKVKAEYACLAVAGIVETTVIKMTNLSWRIDTVFLKERFSFKEVWLLNDMAALAAVVPHLQQDEVVELKKGVAKKDETIAVIAPGTGLGQGYLVRSYGNDFIVSGSEGGHSTFAPANREELELYSWLLQSNKDVSAEDVCSGPGLTLLFNYFVDKGTLIPAEWVMSEAKGKEDLAPVIVEGAAAIDPCPLCSEVINFYLRLLGSESANLALKLYARGGVYIGGGVILHLLDRVSLQPFIKAFLRKGKMTHLLTEIPVYIIKKKHANLHGAMRYARSKF